MTASNKIAVGDDLHKAYMRKHAEIERRLLEGSMMIEEAINGFQSIIDGNYRITWDQIKDEESGRRLAMYAEAIVEKILDGMDEFPGGKWRRGLPPRKIAKINKPSGNGFMTLEAASDGLREKYFDGPGPEKENYFRTTEERIAAIMRYKPELADLREILRWVTGARQR